MIFYNPNHNIDLFKPLQWFLIAHRIKSKLFTIAYMALHNLALPLWYHLSPLFPCSLSSSYVSSFIPILQSLYLLSLSLEHSYLSSLHGFPITQSEIAPCLATLYYMTLFYFLHGVVGFGDHHSISELHLKCLCNHPSCDVN